MTDDYEGVVKRYSLETNNMIQVKEGMNGNQKKDIIYPVEMLFLANKDESVGYRFVYNSCPYKVPELIEDNASKILEAHKQSFEYGGDNRTVIRIIGFYRDFVEGGKPHFVFYYECDQIDSEEFTKRYESKQEELKKKKSSSFDGSEIVCFSLESLGRAEYTIDGIIVDGKRLSMNPSTICSILMILDYLGYLHIN